MKQVTFSKNFAVLRKQKNITQEEMASKCCVSRQAIGKWESGASIPDLYKLSTIAELFGISLDELAYGDCGNDVAGDNTRRQISSLNEKIDKVYNMLLKHEDNEYNLVDEYKKYQDKVEFTYSEDVPATAYSYWGVEEIEKGNYSEGIKCFEEALIRGDINAYLSLHQAYKELIAMDLYEYDENEYWKDTLIFSQKMKQYSEIVEMEIMKQRKSTIV